MPLNRRSFLEKTTIAAAVALTGDCFSSYVCAGDDTPLTTGVGDVNTPTFYRHDIGTSAGRMHEPTAGTDGNIWTSPLDGNLWRYHAPTGEVQMIDLEKLTGRAWKGLHLWPIAYGNDVFLCCPNLSELWVWHRKTGTVKQYPFPHDKPAIYGGFVVPTWENVYFYDTTHAGVLKWNPATQQGSFFPCPYTLSGTLYMTFAEADRHEIWGSTYTGNDIVCFNIEEERWTHHLKSPLNDSTPTPGARVFGETLFVSDHLHGRIFPLNITSGEWGDAVPVPGYKEWFGYVSGGWYFDGKLYMCHSTWTGGTSSLDGEPHHFLGSWSVFDPDTRTFSRLDIPTRDGEERKYLMSDYAATYDDQLYILAVNAKAPQTAIVLRSQPLKG
ncbi:MAG: hypothetical protein WD065_03905 [Planctomycetaceae bacterium]